ncbi:MAG: deacetylase [Bryobacteraceae bacterium]
MKPAFLITIDAEADNQWACSSTSTTENARWLPRFQAVSEQYGFRPTYLADYDMARSSDFVAFACEILRRNAGEIGAHLHPWSTPPIRHLTEDDGKCHPYATEYPPELVAQKLETLTSLLESTFQVKITSHRAGRWGLDAAYARALIRRGYLVDCSVTPGVSWRSSPGKPGGAGGPDFTGCPREPYFMDLEDVRRPGASSLLEVPVTILPIPRPLDRLRKLLRRSRFSPSLTWLRPTGRNRRAMLRLLDRALAERWSCVEFMLHSSEFMPAGSPSFRDQPAIDALYLDLDALFAAAARSFEPSTLTEFAARYVRTGQPA